MESACRRHTKSEKKQYSEMKPGLVLIPGIRKCGTSTLYDMMSKIPGLYTIDDFKESQVFCLNNSDFERNIKLLMADLNVSNYFLDASTLSLYSSNAIQNIKSFFGEVKVVFIVRQPQKRFISAYLHNVKKKNGLEKRQLKEIIKPLLEKGDISKLEIEELRKQQKAGKINLEKIEFNNLNVRYKSDLHSGIDEEFAQLKYYKESCYSEYINEWKLEFGQESIHVISLEKLNSDTENQLQSVCDFLNIAYPEKIDLERSNKTLVANSKLALGTKQLYRKARINSIIKKSAFLKQLVFKIRNSLYTTDLNTLEYEKGDLDKIFQNELAYWKENYPDIYKYWVN